MRPSLNMTRLGEFFQLLHLLNVIGEMELFSMRNWITWLMKMTLPISYNTRSHILTK